VPPGSMAGSPERRRIARRLDPGMDTPASHRLNPSGSAWLPGLHPQRGTRHYTDIFPGTIRTHRPGTARDRVVLHRDGGDGERQRTVITSGRDAPSGTRILRGREEGAGALRGAST